MSALINAIVGGSQRCAVKKTKLFLHIGHGKTGTSAIQSSLAIASKNLLHKGINYPIDSSLRDRASRLEITSGTWEQEPGTHLSEQLLSICKKNQSKPTIMLSSESLFWLIPELIENKSEWETCLDLHIILAVREIEEMLSSEYQQRVKRHGDSMPIEQFIQARNFVSSHHEKAAEIIRLMSQKNIPNTIINYSQHKNDISQVIFRLIGAEELYPADQMSGAIINRSLSSKELEILITINALYYKKYPWICTKISNTLIKKQPKIEAQRCIISSQQLEKIYETNDNYLKTINACLEPSKRLMTISNFNQVKDKVASPQQAQKIRQEETISINLIGEALQQALTHEEKEKLSNNTIDAIIALSQSGTVSKATEFELLKIAKASRPQGAKLTKLLERAKKQLSPIKKLSTLINKII